MSRLGAFRQGGSTKTSSLRLFFGVDKQGQLC